MSVPKTLGKPRPKHSVCVFCGSGPGRDEAYVEAARRFGTALAQTDLGLVYGGGGLGLMGEVARSVLAAGGYVTGIIPEFLRNKERMLRDVDEMIVTSNMHERKQHMFEHSDAFVALPGGIGTLEELVEQMTWAQLGQHDKPIVLANVANFWAPLKGLLDHMRQEAFIRPGLEVRFTIIDRIEDVVPHLTQSFARGAGGYGDEDLIEKL
ncbi:MAG: TIGR00730 family Rossman fold protein [Hyphomicrobiaceae bacterium]